MRGRLSLNALIVSLAACAALVLTVTRPSPEGLIGFGVGDREVRAAPGEPASSVSSKHNLTALKVFNRTLVRIRDSYVEPERIDPKKMLYAALDSVQFNIPEVLVEAYPEKDELVIVVNDKQKRFSAKEVDSPWRLSSKLKKIFRFIEANMNPGADLAQVEYAAVNGMLGTLDPHSVLLDPEMAREMDVNTRGDFGGLGIVIGMRDRKLTVIRPMKNTPAHAAGVKAKDHIVKIDDEVTENLTLQEAVDRMRGKAGTNVTLWVERKGENGLLRYELTRDVIRVPSVDSKLLSKNVGYIKLKQFAGRTSQEVRRAMRDLKSQGAKAWLIDLRWNPGGLLEQAIQVADIFVEQGTIVTTVGGHEREPRRAERRGSDTSSPVAVLVNSNSASASEIVAGALKNLDRAIVVGSTTFGKGSVQILYDNNDGSKLKLTIAQYLTPGDLSIQSLGIVPDIELFRMRVPKQNKGTSDVVRLLPPSRSYREKDLKAHLDSRYAKKQAKSDTRLAYVYEPEPGAADEEGEDEDADPFFDEPPEDEIVVDFEVEIARDLLASIGNSSRTNMVKAARKLIKARRAAQNKKLATALASLGVDWSPPPSSSRGKAKLVGKLEIAGHNGTVEAGEEIELIGTLTNSGTETAYRVGARIEADDSLFNDTEFVFGKIAPGETKSWTVHARVPEDALDRLDYLGFDIYEARKAKAYADPLKFRIIAAERPVFAYAHQLIDQANGDGLVQPGEEYQLRVTVKNIGKGVAKETSAILRNASGTDLLLQKARFELGELGPGESKTVDFAFETAPRLSSDEVVVEMTVYDAVLRENVVEKLKYPARSASAGLARASGSATVVGDNTDIFEGAAPDSARIASADRGATFKVTGKQGNWLRIALADGHPGFVRASSVKRGRKRPTDAGVTTYWQVTPPTLTLNVPSYEVKGRSYQLQGQATDDTRVEDVYIFVSNRDAKVENRKVFYKSNRGGDKAEALHFNPKIPLWPGSNLVTVVARENGDVRSSHTMFLYRSDNRTTVAQPSP